MALARRDAPAPEEWNLAWVRSCATIVAAARPRALTGIKLACAPTAVRPWHTPAMALVFEQLLTASLGDAAYLVGDDDARVCAVVDPQMDSERYLAAARATGWRSATCCRPTCTRIS